MRVPVSRQERGIALLVVLVTLALVTSVVADFQFNSQVDYELAANAWDELQAEYNALSAMRMRAVLLGQGSQLQALVNGLMQIIGGGLAGGAGAGAGVDIGRLLESIPVECGLLSAITRKAGEQLDDEEGEGGDFFTGECVATSESEHGKISLNVLRDPNKQESKDASAALLLLLSDRQFEAYFTEDDRTGYHAESPLELINAITDWVDANKNQTGNDVGDEDRFYERLREPYEAKNAPFDSLAELQLVHGVSDGMYDFLKRHVSIYAANGKPYLSTSSAELVLRAVLAQSGTPLDQVLSDPQLTAAIQALLPALTGLGPVTTQTLASSGLGATPNGLNGLFSASNSAPVWHTIRATGEVGNVSKHVTAVYQAVQRRLFYFRID